ncbi:helix-turn-helix transcriptional regulator [Variovorax ureilyticus]|uniref:Helix-turn-helix transcriptional regulator n=1 Tax=Variovorax ureilyticus TaxID=1836198 RepID=A0ABU8VL45_9BURK
MSAAPPTENESTALYLAQLGAAVRQERKALGFSQEGFADRVKMDRSYMGGVERGERNLSFSNIMRILEGLNMEPGAFFSAHLHLRRMEPQKHARKKDAAPAAKKSVRAKPSTDKPLSKKDRLIGNARSGRALQGAL